MPEGHPLLPEDPARLGAYRLVGRLGEGSQGVVYLGRDASGAHVAIKLLHARMAEHADARKRFVRELAVAKKVARFCTAQVLDADVAGDRPYIVSEYVEGRSLRAHILADGPRSGGALERLAVGTLTALAAIHNAGIVHRDFTPRNVLLGPDGPRVIDFGIARALGAARSAETGSVGTPAYMAPEQVAARPVGPPADMFAWGATVLFAATGRPPFGNESVAAVMDRILHTEPDVTVLPEPLRSVVAASLAKDPALRPTADQAQAGLLGREASEAMTPPPAFGAARGRPSAGTDAETPAPPRDTSPPETASPSEDAPPTVPTPVVAGPVPGDGAVPGYGDGAVPGYGTREPATPASPARVAGAGAPASDGAVADGRPPRAGTRGPGGGRRGRSGRPGRSGRRRMRWALPVAGAGAVAAAVLAMIAWPDGGDAASPPPARAPLAAPSTPPPSRPPADRLMTRSLRRPSPTPAEKRRKKHSAKPATGGCHDYSRAYGVPNTGSVLLKVTVCREAYSGTAVLADTARDDGWDVCFQLRGHVPKPAETYVSTMIMTSRNGAAQSFNNGPSVRFGAGAHRSEDAVIVNVGRCQGSGSAVRSSWQTHDRLAAG